MKVTDKVIVAAFIGILAVAATASSYVIVGGEHVLNSLVDSTPIGTSSPSTGAFTALSTSGNASIGGNVAAGNVQATGYLTASAPQQPGGNFQGATVGWNLNTGFGETDFINTHPSSIGGGWYWYGSTTKSNGSFLAAKMDEGGTLTLTNNLNASAISSSTLSSATVTAGAGGFHTSAQSVLAGLTLNGGISTAGPNMLTGTTSTNHINVVNSAQGDGQVVASLFNGPLNGNASTASSLQNAGSVCGGATGGYAYGVDRSGNALCGQNGHSFGTNGYQYLPDGLILEWGVTQSFDTGPVSVSFPLAFPNSCMNVQITQNADAGTTLRSWGSENISNSGFYAINDGSGAGRWFAIGW